MTIAVRTTSSLVGRQRTRFQVSSILAVLMAAGLLATLFQNRDALVPYFLSCVVLYAPLLITPRDYRHRYYLLLVAVVVFGTYLLRSIVLVEMPGEFTFGVVSRISRQVVSQTLFDIIPSTVFLVIGSAIPLMVSASDAVDQDRASVADVRRRVKVGLYVCYASLLLSAFLVGAYGIGIKSQAAGTHALAYVARMNPSFVCVGMATVYLVRYWRVMSPNCRVALAGYLVINGLLVIACGSKKGLALVLFAWFVVQMVQRNDFTISTTSFMKLQIALVLTVFIAFPLAGYIKHTDTVEGAADLFAKRFSASSSIALVTKRVGALDGSIVVRQYQPAGLKRAFKWDNVVSNSAARLVPFIDTAHLTTGTAVGIYYQGMDRKHKYAGGIGLFAAMELMFGVDWLATGVFALLAAVMFRCFNTTRDVDKRLVLLYVFFYFLVNSIISGNIGVTMSLLVVNCCHVYMIFWVFRGLGVKAVSSYA